MANLATQEERDTPLFVSIKRAAQVLGLSEWVVRQHLPIEKVGGRYYVPSQALRDYAAQASA